MMVKTPAQDNDNLVNLALQQLIRPCWVTSSLRSVASNMPIILFAICGWNLPVASTSFSSIIYLCTDEGAAANLDAFNGAHGPSETGSCGGTRTTVGGVCDGDGTGRVILFEETKRTCNDWCRTAIDSATAAHETTESSFGQLFRYSKIYGWEPTSAVCQTYQQSASHDYPYL